jgi:hypothetical protein
MLPPALVPVALTEQIPPALRAQLGGLNDAEPAPLDCHVMLSPMTEPAKPDRVAVHVDEPPTVIVEGAHTTASLGVAILTVTVLFHELAPLLASPP